MFTVPLLMHIPISLKVGVNNISKQVQLTSKFVNKTRAANRLYTVGKRFDSDVILTFQSGDN